MRRRGPLIVAGVILALLLACAVVGAIGVGVYVLSGNLDIPYPDGPPPTPTVRP